MVLSRLCGRQGCLLEASGEPAQPLSPPSSLNREDKLAGQPSIYSDRTAHTPRPLPFRMENSLLKNWIIWSETIRSGRFLQSPNPRFTHLLPESYSSPKPPQSAPWYHFCSPKPLHTTTPMRVSYKGVILLRTLCSKETSGGSTYIKHTAGPSGLSQPLSSADCPMQTAASGVLGQTRPISGLQSASVSTRSRRSTQGWPHTTHTPVYTYLER